MNNNEFKSFYKTVGGKEGEKCFYPTRLDTYGRGCHYDCKYCYSKSLLDFRKMWNPSNPGIADIEKIKRKIKKLEPYSVVRLGGMTDCFQPIEKQHEITYKTIKALNKQKIHYLIITKSNLISDDKYLDILDDKLAHIQVSIPSSNNEMLSLTDNAPTFEERKNTIEILQDLNFDVSLRISPFLITHQDDMNKINRIKVDKCLVEFLRINHWVEKWLGKYLNFNMFTLKENGYKHLELKTKLKLLKKLDFSEITVCDDVNKHYNYFRKYYNINPNDCCNLRL